jgi:hypothetical protein
MSTTQYGVRYAMPGWGSRPGKAVVELCATRTHAEVFAAHKQRNGFPEATPVQCRIEWTPIEPEGDDE